MITSMFGLLLMFASYVFGIVLVHSQDTGIANWSLNFQAVSGSKGKQKQVDKLALGAVHMFWILSETHICILCNVSFGGDWFVWMFLWFSDWLFLKVKCGSFLNITFCNSVITLLNF